VGLAATLVAPPRRRESVPVPIVFQAELLAKVLEYDRNFPPRAADRSEEPHAYFPCVLGT
jgi:hypothetical protein